MFPFPLPCKMLTAPHVVLSAAAAPPILSHTRTRACVSPAFASSRAIPFISPGVAAASVAIMALKRC
ncbi:hypothetical protein T484DRAFT_1966525 [Baffinella frigidus]|nr:hypothetical protein T484DRAFT_1966525 [Cryptophyta sp. CCMP2293]